MDDRIEIGGFVMNDCDGMDLIDYYKMVDWKEIACDFMTKLLEMQESLESIEQQVIDIEYKLRMKL